MSDDIFTPIFNAFYIFIVSFFHFYDQKFFKRRKQQNKGNLWKIIAFYIQASAFLIK